MKLRQVNIALPEEKVFRLKRIALDHRISFQALGEVAFDKLLDMKPTLRSAAVSGRKKKIAGRKIALEVSK